MTHPRILVFAGSSRRGSLNQRLVDLAARRLKALAATVTELKLSDYPLPIYDADLEMVSGTPAEAQALHEQFRCHDAVFIASPEYNSAPPPLLVNALTWVSRVASDGGMVAAFDRQAFALGAASPGAFGGYRGLVALRQQLELGLFAHVQPSMISVPAAHQAFNEDGDLANARSSEMLDRTLAELVAASERR